MNGYTVGRRIAYWRERRRLTQADFGALMGQSRRWVQSLESGVRQVDPRLSVVENAARVLRIPLVWLLSDAVGEVERVDAVELEAIRAVLHRHDVITGTVDDDAAEPVALDALRRQVAHGWDTFQASRFALLGRLLPELLTSANRAAARHTGHAQGAAYRALAMALCLTEAVSVKFGSGSLAVLAAHRAVLAAERCGDAGMRGCGDAAVMATATRHLADAMTEDGQPAAATQFATAAAARLPPDLVAAGPDGLSTLGALYLKAAMAQATAAVGSSSSTAAAGAARAVPGLLDQATEHADHLDGTGAGDGNAMWSAFSAANVSLYRLATHVQLDQGAEGVAVARPCPRRAPAGCRASGVRTAW